MNAAFLVLDLVALIVSGFCGMMIWNWFIPTCFTSVPSISFVSSVGMIFVASVFVSSGKTYDYEEIRSNPDTFTWKCAFNQLINGIMHPIVLTCTAWVIHTLFV